MNLEKENKKFSGFMTFFGIIGIIIVIGLVIILKYLT